MGQAMKWANPGGIGSLSMPLAHSSAAGFGAFEAQLGAQGAEEPRQEAVHELKIRGGGVLLLALWVSSRNDSL
jgi:hypothetical protein